jgi:phosphomannomutase
MEIFRTYDIRGFCGKDLNETVAYKIGRAFVLFLKCKQVCIGRDMRSTSPELFNGLAKGITDQGADVVDIGLASTDMLYFAVAHNDFESGIMITASHCGKELNGMKLTRKKGVPVSGGSGMEEIKEIYDKYSTDFISMVENNFPSPENEKGKVIVKENVLTDFVDNAKQFVDISQIKPLKVVCDAGNGMAGFTLPKLFEGLPITLIPLYFELDGNFPNHEANPLIPEFREDIVAKIREENADLGIMYDGDSDRIAFFDETGHYIQSDLLLGFIIDKLFTEHQGKTVVYDLRCSWYVKDMIARHGLKGILSKVGYANIKPLMKENNSVIGSEMSGHFFWPIDQGNNENTLVTTLVMLEILSKENKKMSELFAETKNYFLSGEVNFKVKDKNVVIEKLKEKYHDGEQLELDGISVKYEHWHFNVRESQNDPVLRLVLETKSKALLDEKFEELKKIIES